MAEENSLMLTPVPGLPPVVPSTDVVSLTTKRRKGRPPKNKDPLSTQGNGTAKRSMEGRGRRLERKNGYVTSTPRDGEFVGQQVQGVLDGSFDAGYLLTVKVGNTQTVLRGAVFEPSLAAPISKANDIAPSIKFIDRAENVAAVQYPMENSALALLEPPTPSSKNGNAGLQRSVLRDEDGHGHRSSIGELDMYTSPRCTDVGADQEQPATQLQSVCLNSS